MVLPWALSPDNAIHGPGARMESEGREGTRWSTLLVLLLPGTFCSKVTMGSATEATTAAVGVVPAPTVEKTNSRASDVASEKDKDRDLEGSFEGVAFTKAEERKLLRIFDICMLPPLTFM